MPKLMLVEDDNNLREIYEARLQAEGFTIVSAKDGEEALAVAKAEKPDLIISDVMMPKISGFEMLDILRNTEELKNVKVIMLTALGQSVDQQRANKLGADRYLVKSQVTLEDIVKVTHELLDGNAAQPVGAAPTTTDSPSPASTPPAEPTAIAPVDPAPPVQDPPAIPPAPEPSEPAQVQTTAPAVPEAAAVVEPEPGQAPEPAPEPTAIAPVDPAPPVQDPPATPPAPEPKVDLTASDAAESSSQEASDINAQINNFVAGAEPSGDTATAPVEPASDSETAGETVIEPGSSVSPESSASATESSGLSEADSANNDKLMDDTVHSLLQEGDKEAAAGLGQDVVPSVPTPEEESSGAASKTPSEIEASERAKERGDGVVAEETDTPQNDNVTIAHKKVIKPLSNPTSKPDIQTLYQIEEAKEAGTTSPGNETAPTAVIADDNGKTEQPLDTPATPPAGADPNNIAL